VNSRLRRLAEAAKPPSGWSPLDFELNDLAGRIQQGKFGSPLSFKEPNKKYALKEIVDLLVKASKLAGQHKL
jgi:hypothetical protein